MIYSELYKNRKKIYCNIISGKYSNIRLFFISIFIICYFLIPLLNYKNRQAVIFDIINYKIYFFNYIFYPNDFVLFCIIILIFLIIFFLITLLYGRLWCGYLCPQTVMLYIFNVLSVIFEGNRNNRIKIDNHLFDFYVFFLKIFKHFIFLFFLFLGAIFFVGYFVSSRALINSILFFKIDNFIIFIIIFITFLLYFELIFLGEQFCFLICPYARFQNIMYDENTTIVKYDVIRGEPRKYKKKNYSDFGDCISCFQCVYSCPTGIDIRNGEQIECINCGVCADACNNVMIKVSKPINLILYKKDYNVSKFTYNLYKKKLFIFSFILLCLFSIFVYLLNNKTDLEFIVYRNQQTLYNNLSDNIIENNYILKFFNKSNNDIFCNVNVSNFDNIDMNYIGPTNLIINSDCISNVYIKIHFFLNKEMKKNFYKIFFNIKYVKNKVDFFLKKEVNFFIF
ncbi:MAG: cytochrome c oxidase accessory protein CcoG [Candidatus Azosocius agrarius]|nr:MAG: cytochrome c oxidase accessory protein CcoG [Gammaproteobacteria bacterium]